MDILFLDANVLFSAAYREGAGIAGFWDLDDVELITSQYAAEEVRRNLPEAHQKSRLDDLSDVGRDCTLHRGIKYIIMPLMRTTIDIPEDVLRRAKAEAALRGMSLKSWVTDAIRAALQTELAAVGESPAVGYVADQQVLSDEAVFPLIRGEGGPALRDLTPERVHEILEQEEVERALERAPRSR